MYGTGPSCYRTFITNKVSPSLVDIYIADQNTGAFLLVEVAQTKKEAAEFTKQWRRLNTDAGLLLWPNGITIPHRVLS